MIIISHLKWYLLIYLYIDKLININSQFQLKKILVLNTHILPFMCEFLVFEKKSYTPFSIFSMLHITCDIILVIFFFIGIQNMIEK